MWLSAPRWISLKLNWVWCTPSHSFMILGSVVVIIVSKSIIAGLSLTGLGSVGAGVGWLQVVMMWSSDCADVRCSRGIAALGPCELGLAADLVIIDPILGSTGQVCPSGVPQKPLRWGLLGWVQDKKSLVLCRQSAMQQTTQTNVQTMQCISSLSAFGSRDRTWFLTWQEILNNWIVMISLKEEIAKILF